MSSFRASAACMAALLVASSAQGESVTLAPGVRGVATRAPAGMKIDGDLSEFQQAFGTPVEYFSNDLKNRAAQFFYMWDDEAFYAGLRTIDQKQANPAPDDRLWMGDAVEWYFDTRRGEQFRSIAWPKEPAGAVHCYWTGYTKDQVAPRFCLRPDYLQQIPNVGVEVGARKIEYGGGVSGAEIEFKLPWSNFPGFRGKPGEVIALDAEICYGDGAERVNRSFVYGGPLSVQQPANLAKVQLVDKLEPAHWKQCGPVMMPIRCDTDWNPRQVKAHAHALVALPPNFSDTVGKVVVRVLDLEGKTIGDFPAERDAPRDFASTPNFGRLRASWPIDVAPPGQHEVLAIVYDKSGGELTRVSPRLVSVREQPGY